MFRSHEHNQSQTPPSASAHLYPLGQLVGSAVLHTVTSVPLVDYSAVLEVIGVALEVIGAPLVVIGVPPDVSPSGERRSPS